MALWVDLYVGLLMLLCGLVWSCLALCGLVICSFVVLYLLFSRS